MNADSTSKNISNFTELSDETLEAAAGGVAGHGDDGSTGIVDGCTDPDLSGGDFGGGGAGGSWWAPARPVC